MSLAYQDSSFPRVPKSPRDVFTPRAGSAAASTENAVPWAALLSASIVPLLIVAIRCSSGTTANISYFLLAVYALVGPRQAIISLFLLWFFNMLNHGLVPTATGAALSRHLVVAAALLSAAVHSGGVGVVRAGAVFWSTLGICLFLFAHSATASLQVDVSLMKSLAFTMAITTLVLCWSSLDQSARRLTSAFLFVGLTVMMLASLPLIWSPIGYFRNGNGFQGIFVHPQNFGPTMAVLGVFVTLRMLTQRRLSAVNALILVATVGCIYLSKARIGALAFVVGIGGALVAQWLRTRWARYRDSDRVKRSRLVLGAAAATAVAIAAGPRIIEQVQAFVAKGTREESLIDTALAARGATLNEMLENIQQHPVLGIGFGINASTDYYQIARDPVFNLPIMATVEKGIMPVAIVEETGALGALLTFPWLLLLFIRSTRAGLLCSGVFLAVLATNVAEANFFSPGGQGMFQLIFAFWAVSGGATAAPQIPSHRLEQSVGRKALSSA